MIDSHAAPNAPDCKQNTAVPLSEAALERVNEAVQLWIDTARERGDPVPEPKGERLMLA